MAFSANLQQFFPAVPPFQSAGDHEMRDHHAEQDASRPAGNQASYLKPYLGLRARLSQAYINKWTVLITLILIRYMFLFASVLDSLASARREANGACLKVESVGSSMASMPHFMSKGVNDLTGAGVEKAIHGLMSMLALSVTGVEEIIIFVIHMMTSTYLCLISLAVNGAVGAAADLAKQFTDTINKVMDEVAGDVTSGVKSLTDGMKGIVDKINSIPSVPDFKIPEFNVDKALEKAKNINFPQDMQNSLNKLKDNMPNFDETQKAIDDLIRIPFDLVKEKINGKLSFEFDRNLLPVPEKAQLDFCSEGNVINNFFDDLDGLVAQAKKVALGVLITALILAIPIMGYLEYRRYRKMQQHSHRFQQGTNGMEVVYMASRPNSAGWGLWIGQRFGSGSRKDAVRWAIAYATSPAALFVLSLAVAGLFSCLGQTLFLKTMQDKAPGLTDQVAGFADKVVTSLNESSLSWSKGVNGAVDSLNREINEEVLGWVKQGTDSVNDTLNAFTQKTGEIIEKALGGTPLEGPVKDVVRCLIGLKVESFQKGLTWVHDHASVSFPGVSPDMFSLGALAQVSNSSSAAQLLADPSGKAKDEISEAVDHVIRKFLDSLRFELHISAGLLLTWAFVALSGICVAAFHMFRGNNYGYQADPYILEPTAERNIDTAEKGTPADPAPAYEYPVNKAAPYTITPRPAPGTMPTFGPSDTTHYGEVDAHSVSSSSRPGHLRASSHVHLADPSPSDEKVNPFVSPLDEKRKSPFDDH